MRSSADLIFWIFNGDCFYDTEKVRIHYKSFTFSGWKHRARLLNFYIIRNSKFILPSKCYFEQNCIVFFLETRINVHKWPNMNWYFIYPLWWIRKLEVFLIYSCYIFSILLKVTLSSHWNWANAFVCDNQSRHSYKERN